MRYLSAALLLVALPALADVQDRVKADKEVTVLVSNEGLLGSGRGSGILIDPTHVVTCAHMADRADDELFIYTYPLGRVIKAHIVYVEQATDTMLLVLESSVSASHYAKFEPHYYDGENVTIIGNALGAMNWLVSRGVVSGSERGQLLTDAHVNHGNSGGPWFNDAGYVIAMSDWIIVPKEGPGIAGAVSAAQILSMLERYEHS